MNNSRKFLVVLFFHRHYDGTYRLVGRSNVLIDFQAALDISYANHNPTSQILGADTLRNLVLEIQEMKANMANRQYVAENVDPYI